jgi:hypothetical protein
MVSDLLVVVPTRGRRENTERFLRSFEATAELPANVCLITDDDDMSYDDITLPPSVGIICIPRASTQVKVNYAAIPGALTHRAVMFLGDDNVFTTAGWDHRIMDRLSNIAAGMVHVNDLGGRESLIACNMAISSEIIRELGWFDEPSMNHFGVDNVWMELGVAANCLSYLPDVVIEHRHYIFGKAPEDQLYSETRRRWWDEDEVALVKWRAERRDADLAKVMSATRKAQEVRGSALGLRDVRGRS